jgi:hypothetical protein
LVTNFVAIFFVCHQSGPGFPTPYVVFFYMFNDFMSEVIVCFVDIGGIVDHQSKLSFYNGF